MSNWGVKMDNKKISTCLALCDEYFPKEGTWYSSCYLNMKSKNNIIDLLPYKVDNKKWLVTNLFLNAMGSKDESIKTLTENDLIEFSTTEEFAKKVVDYEKKVVEWQIDFSRSERKENFLFADNINDAKNCFINDVFNALSRTAISKKVIMTVLIENEEKINKIAEDIKYLWDNVHYLNRVKKNKINDDEKNM